MRIQIIDFVGVLMVVAMAAHSAALPVLEKLGVEPLTSDTRIDTLLASFNVTFQPAETLALRMNEAEENFTIFVTSPNPTTISLLVEHPNLVELEPAASDCESCSHATYTTVNGTTRIDIQLRGIRIGKTSLKVYINASTTGETEIAFHPIVVVPVISRLTVIGLIIFICGMGLNLMGFGATVRMEMIKDIAKDPRAIVISFCLQILFMPGAAYLLGLIFGLPVYMRLSLFICGCCPSGTPSNIYSFLFQGDVSRSVVMTLVSTVVTIVFMPYWVLTVGNSILHEAYPDRHINVPWPQLVLYLLIFSVPGILGILVGCFAPLKASRLVATLLRPVGLLIVVVGAGMVLGTLGFIFEYVDTWQTIMAPACLPLVGCLVGFPLAAVLTKNNRVGITVGMETLFQNIAMAVMWLGINLPQPEAFFAILMPGTVIISSIIEPLLVLPFVVMCRRCNNCPCGRNSRGDLGGETSESMKEREANAVPRERRPSIHYIL